MGDGWVVIPAERTPEERSEVYDVEWREPANSSGIVDRLWRLFG